MMNNYRSDRLKKELDLNHHHHTPYTPYPKRFLASNIQHRRRGSGASSSSSNTSSPSSTLSTNNVQKQQQQQQQQQQQNEQDKDEINILPFQREYLGFTIYRALTTYGVCVIDNFLKGELAEQLFTLVESLSSSQGLLHDPMVSVSNDKKERFTRYRDDYITWLTGSKSGNQCIEKLNFCLDKIIKLFYRYSLSQNHRYCLTQRSSVQVSCFPPNSMGYKLHSDNPNNNGRLLTLVFHCSKGYEQITHEGCSRFFTNNSKYIDVQPKFNRLVLYWSSNYLEIQPCISSLYSLTTWFNGSKMKQQERYYCDSSLTSPLMMQSPYTASSKQINRDFVDQ